jgi:hypothetical protein
LTSFDAKRIRINKKVKEYYEALALYHQNNAVEETVIAAPVVVETPINTNPFERFRFKKNEELAEENYDPHVKVIKILG